MTEAYELENAFVRFRLSTEHNQWTLQDRRAGVSWGNTLSDTPWVTVGSRSYRLSAVEAFPDDAEGAALHARFVEPSDGSVGPSLVFHLVGDALQVYAIPEQDSCSAITLFGAGIEARAAEKGELLLPIRMGLVLPAAGKAFNMKLGTYEYEHGVHMAMVGVLKAGAALMATWGDPYVTVGATRALAEGEALLRVSFELSKSARSLELRCLGPGDLSTVAEAYREHATARGYRVTWNQKLKERPEAARLFGACNVKLWHALARRIDADMVEQSVEVQWTFDEAAQIAEHLRHDLELEDVLFHLGGWTRYGYDCRHPDIMPANPECGGDAGLIDCARRVQACGYLFCLHDNYQDIYRDAPSWDEEWLQKEANGAPHKGGVWLGGQAYYTCAREALRLAQRPENLPLVRDTIHPDAYFIDTTYAVGPQECYDPRHPLTKQDDIHWKQALSDYARELFGIFGSECGREWAVPHADFFEGLTSVSGRYYHILNPDELDGRVVPFFDMVFRDCIALHGKYGYRPETMGEQVVHHVAMGRTLYYHSLGKHLYWQDPAGLAEAPLAEGPYDPAVFTRGHNGWAEGLCLWDRFIKNTHEVLGPLNLRTSQTLIQQHSFLDEARLIQKTVFANGAKTLVNGSAAPFEAKSDLGGVVVLPPYGFLVETADFIAFHATQWNGYTYKAPVLFTLASKDGRPLTTSRQGRVYHGFGESEFLLWDITHDVPRQATLLRL